MATIFNECNEEASGCVERNVPPTASSSDEQKEPAVTGSTASSPATSTNALQETTGTLQEQEAIVFGSNTIAEDLADAMAEFVKRSIQSGVESLPLLLQEDVVKQQPLSKTAALVVDKIQRPYMKYIDVMQAYAERNIFTLRHWPPRRRQRIVVQQQQHLGNPNVSASDASEDQPLALPVPTATLQATEAISSSPSSSSERGSSCLWYPSPQDRMPTQEEMTVLQEDLSHLAKQLQTAKDYRTELLEQCDSLAATRSLTAGAVQALEATDPTMVATITTTVTMGGQGLQELTREANRVQSELGKRKQQHQNSNNNQDDENGNNNNNEYILDDLEGAGHSSRLPKNNKKRVLTLEEAYFHERQAVETTVENLSSLANRLKQSKRGIHDEPS